MKRRIFIVGHAGYPFDVTVAIGVSDDEIVRALEKRCDLSPHDRETLSMQPHGSGRTVMLDGGGTLIRLNSFTGTPDEWGHLAHEIFHAVEFLMAHIGILLSRDSDEAFAYAIGNLTKRIVAKLKARR